MKFQESLNKGSNIREQVRQNNIEPQVHTLLEKSGMTASDMMKELSNVSRTEAENSLLKTALIQSSENCEELMKQSLRLLHLAEQQRLSDSAESRSLVEEMSDSILQMSRENKALIEALNKNSQQSLSQVHATMVDLKGDIKKTIAKEIKEVVRQQVDEALQSNIEAINKSSEVIKNNTKNQSEIMRNHLKQYKEAQKKFFQMDSIREIFFWFSSVSSILMIIFMLWYLFFH